MQREKIKHLDKEEQEQSKNTPGEVRKYANELLVTLRVPEEKARICKEAVELEAKNQALARSSVDLRIRRDGLVVDINSDDISSMRAALNTYLRWVGMCLDLVENDTGKK